MLDGDTFVLADHEQTLRMTVRNDSEVSPISSSNTSTHSTSATRSAMKFVRSLVERTGSLLDKVAAQKKAEQGLARVRISSLAESMAIK